MPIVYGLTSEEVAQTITRLNAELASLPTDRETTTIMQKVMLYTQLAALYELQDKYDEALKCAREVGLIYPNPIWINVTANLLRRKLDLHGASEAYNNYISNIGGMFARLASASMLRQLGLLRESAQKYEAIVNELSVAPQTSSQLSFFAKFRKGPTYGEWYYNAKLGLADVYFDQGNFIEAEKIYLDVAKNADALYKAADIDLHTGICSRIGIHEQALYKLAKIYEKQDNIYKAKKYYRDYIRKASQTGIGYSDAALSLAEIYRKNNQISEAIHYYRKAEIYFPNTYTKISPPNTELLACAALLNLLLNPAYMNDDEEQKPDELASARMEYSVAQIIIHKYLIVLGIYPKSFSADSYPPSSWVDAVNWLQQLCDDIRFEHIHHIAMLELYNIYSKRFPNKAKQLLTEICVRLEKIDDPYSVFKVAQIMIESKDPRAADWIAKATLARDWFESKLFLTDLIKLGDLYKDNGDLEKALEIYTKALELMPQQKNYFDTYNLLYDRFETLKQDYLLVSLLKMPITEKELSRNAGLGLIATDNSTLELAQLLEKFEQNREQPESLNATHRSRYWYQQAAGLGNETAIGKLLVLLDQKLAGQPDLAEKLAECFSCEITRDFLVFPVAAVFVGQNGSPQARSYEKMALRRVKPQPGDVQFNFIERAFNLAKKVQMVNRDPHTTRKLIRDPIENQTLRNLFSYILDTSEPIQIAEFPGFINPKTSKRFVEPWITDDGITVEKGDPTAVAQDLTLMEVMLKFPPLLAADYLQQARDSLNHNHVAQGLEFALKAFKQATIEHTPGVIGQAIRLLQPYLPTDTKLSDLNSLLSALEHTLKEILGNEYAILYDTLIDPVSHTFMLNPFALRQTGNTVEKYELELALDKRRRDPTNNVDLSDCTILPNHAVAKIIPYILTCKHDGISIKLYDLPMFKDQDGQRFEDPYLNAAGETVEAGSEDALCPNHLLKQVMAAFPNPTTRATMRR